MRRTVRRRRDQAGFTLIELMISLLMFALVISGVLSIAVSMVQGYRETRGVISAEDSVRVPMDFIADAVRQASPGVPSGLIQDAATCSTQAITIVNSTSSSDTLDIIYASGAVVTSTRTNYVAGSTSVTVTDASQLRAGDFIVITDLTQGHLVEISAIVGSVLTLAPQCLAIVLPSNGYVAGSIVVRAQHATFFVGTVDGVPTLMFDPDSTGSDVAEPLAEGVEDFQVSIGIDQGTNGVSSIGAAANDDEWIYNVGGDTYPAGGIKRALRVTLVSRSPAAAGTSTLYSLPAVEDRPAGTGDAYRRRVLHSTIELRNFGGSP